MPQDGLAPIDMQDQERIKLERKRYRNRIAASKCRQRKLERISKLSDRVGKMENKNQDLLKYIHLVQGILGKINNTIVRAHQEMGCDMRDRPFC